MEVAVEVLLECRLLMTPTTTTVPVGLAGKTPAPAGHRLPLTSGAGAAGRALEPEERERHGPSANFRRLYLEEKRYLHPQAQEPPWQQKQGTGSVCM